MLAAGDGRGGIPHLGYPQGAKAHSSENREALNEITPMIEGLWQHTAGCFASPGFVPPLSFFPGLCPGALLHGVAGGEETWVNLLGG